MKFSISDTIQEGASLARQHPYETFYIVILYFFVSTIIGITAVGIVNDPEMSLAGSITLLYISGQFGIFVFGAIGGGGITAKQVFWYGIGISTGFIVFGYIGFYQYVFISSFFN